MTTDTEAIEKALWDEVNAVICASSLISARVRVCIDLCAAMLAADIRKKEDA